MKNQNKNKILCSFEPSEIVHILTIANVVAHTLQTNSSQLDTGNPDILSKYTGAPQLTQPARYW